MELTRISRPGRRTLILRNDGMKFQCLQGCHKCCELDTFINFEDINRWIDEDKPEILACLTWHRIRGRIPEDMLFIPHKKHVIGHSFLRLFYKKEWDKNNECIFLNNVGKCRIYSTRPTACRNFPHGKVDYECPGMSEVNDIDRAEEKRLAHERTKADKEVYRNREIISAAIKKAKADADLIKLTELLGFKEEIVDANKKPSKEIVIEKPSETKTV